MRVNTNKKAGAFASAFLFFASLKYASHARKRAATRSNHGSPSDYTCKTFRFQKYIACSHLQDTEKPRGVCPGACVFYNASLKYRAAVQFGNFCRQLISYHPTNKRGRCVFKFLHASATNPARNASTSQTCSGVRSFNVRAVQLVGGFQSCL